MTIEVVLVASGLIGMAVGLLVANRLRKWRPHSSVSLTEYDPGPDLFDWLQPLAFVASGLALVVTALVV